MMMRNDLLGKTFGHLRVVKLAGQADSGRFLWECACACGGIRIVSGTALRVDGVTSCKPCAQNRHGNTAEGKWSPEYMAWAGMKCRCETVTSTSYPRYGAKGVRVCERWQLFDNFLADMGPKPSPRHSLDRIDNAKGYEPGNCRWASLREQAQNKSNNVYVEYQGQKVCLTEYARRSGVNYNTIRSRLQKGIALHEAIKPAAAMCLES